MGMGPISTNRRVLKLVHVGGTAEIHVNPISAAEVMRRNPRHFVTRPDVFRFPWVVVRPESILKPGNVFFIVPHYTVHRLLEAHRQQQQDRFLQYKEESSFSQEGHTIESLIEITEHNHQLINQKQGPQKSQTRAKIDCRFEDEDTIFPKGLEDSNKRYPAQFLDEQSSIEAQFEVKSRQHFYDSDSLNEIYPTNTCSLLCGYKYRQNESRCSSSSQGSRCSSSAQAMDLSNSQEEKLKSCLKKNRSPKVRNLRVKFALPDED